MSSSFKASICHYPPPSLPLPSETIPDVSKPEIQKFYKAGRAVLRAQVESWISTNLQLGNEHLFRETAVKAVDENIEALISRLAAYNLPKKSIKLRVISFFVQVGREDVAFDVKIIGSMLDFYLDEFSHLFKRWRPVAEDFDGSPQSAIRRTEHFRIPAFRRDLGTASQVDSAVLLRRSQRLASRPVKASSTAGQQGFLFRQVGEIPVTPTKGRKKATQDALEHPAKRRRLADVSNLAPSQSISMAPLKVSRKPANDESISAAPFKVVKARKQGTRERVKRFFGVVDENAVSNGTRSRSKA
ncbi:hypothetical protein BT96DRAFT_1000653 [Gymnopus androsaceus JB14]|uniref:Uncharacterized protein n=1 Tax=Gymnopus androsaceus JB14 TaxID=1447944 RepID=A0A6A4H307_9AGAR|nr:hypothetical protein BT96DRAFT_1000653 [Gymnopus androsaceus JB14]